MFVSVRNVLDKMDARFKWPRLVRMVENYVGSRGLAVRYVNKAVMGDQLYQKIVKEAFIRRHNRRRKKTGT